MGAFLWALPPQSLPRSDDHAASRRAGGEAAQPFKRRSKILRTRSRKPRRFVRSLGFPGKGFLGAQHCRRSEGVLLLRRLESRPELVERGERTPERPIPLASVTHRASWRRRGKRHAVTTFKTDVVVLVIKDGVHQRHRGLPDEIKVSFRFLSGFYLGPSVPDITYKPRFIRILRVSLAPDGYL